MSLGIGRRMNLKNTLISKILIHIPLSVMEKGLGKVKKGFPKITLEDNLFVKEERCSKINSVIIYVCLCQFITYFKSITISLS